MAVQPVRAHLHARDANRSQLPRSDARIASDIQLVIVALPAVKHDNSTDFVQLVGIVSDVKGVIAFASLDIESDIIGQSFDLHTVVCRAQTHSDIDRMIIGCREFDSP